MKKSIIKSFYINHKLKSFKLKKGNFKRLQEYKDSLVSNIKLLKEENSNLENQIAENKKNTEKLSDLSESITNLENQKLNLEKDISKLLRAKELIINIKDLEKQENLLKINIEHLEEIQKVCLNSLNSLKEEKALLIDEIENLDASKNVQLSKEKYTMEYVDSLDGLAFEKYFSEILDKLGFYDIKVTSSSGDYGIDVLASYDDISYGFQCKLYSEDVGNKAIQEAFSGKEHYGCNIAVVVTNRFFTEPARIQAKETKVLLWDRTVLSAKLKQASKVDFVIN